MTRRAVGFFLLAGISGIACAQEAGPVYVFSTLAGSGSSGSVDGVGTSARFNHPFGVAVDGAGNVFVTESTGHVVRKITPDGTVTTLAGLAGQVGVADGTGSAARFGTPSPSSGNAVPSGPHGIAVDKVGRVYVSDTTNATIRRIMPDGVVTTFAGMARNWGGADTAPGVTATLHQPLGVATDEAGNVFVADCFNQTIRMITPAGVVTTIAGVSDQYGYRNGAGSDVRFLYPDGIAVDREGNLVVTDSNYVVRRLVRATAGGVTTWTASALAGSAGDFGSVDGMGTQARFGGLNASSPVNAVSYLFTPNSGGAPPAQPGYGLTVAGLGGVAVDEAGNVFLADTLNHTIRRITPAGVTTTVGGAVGQIARNDGIGTAARFGRPKGLALDKAGNLYIADSFGHSIRKGTLMFAPRIAAAPRSQAALAGSALTLTVDAAAYPPPAFQWNRNGTALAGATASSLSFASLRLTDAGAYTVTITNSLGAATSASATLAVHELPRVITPPVAQSVLGGQSLTLSVTTTGTPQPAIQWRRDGIDLPGATQATLAIGGAQAADAGSYTAVVTNAAGSAVSGAAVVSVNTARIVNLSIRSHLAAGATLITGFVVSGGTKPMLLRGVGPALAAFGVSGFLTDPRLGLFSGSTPLAANDNWSGAVSPAQIAAAAAQTGAFALPPAGFDAALLANVDGGAFTVQVSGPAAAGGIVLVELYDASPATAARLINVSARSRVGTGESVLLAGFVVTGNAAKTVLVRGVGPALAGFGVIDALADPKVEILSAGVTAPLHANDDWGGGALGGVFAAVGAFPLPLSSKDAALVATLAPGSYTVQVSGVGGATGEALVEIYELP